MLFMLLTMKELRCLGPSSCKDAGGAPGFHMIVVGATSLWFLPSNCQQLKMRYQQRVKFNKFWAFKLMLKELKKALKNLNFQATEVNEKRGFI